MAGPDYDVGYGRPPVETRFQKGHSGNPAGRRNGSRNVSSLIADALNEKVVINEHGKRRKISKLQAAFMQQANKAASGDLKATRLMMDLLIGAELRDDARGSGETITPEVRRARDQQLLAVLRARVDGGEDGGQD